MRTRARPALRRRASRCRPGRRSGWRDGPPEPLLQLEWCAPFSGPVRRPLHALKYAGERRLAGPLGAAVAGRWRRVGAGGELLVPVPVHEGRRRERGYDQAALIAGAAAAALGLPMARCRSRATGRRPPSSTSTGARAGGQRRGRVRRPAPGHERGRSRGRWVVLVDDVVTTGATLAPARRAPRRGGRRRSARSPSRASGERRPAGVHGRTVRATRSARTFATSRRAVRGLYSESRMGPHPPARRPTRQALTRREVTVRTIVKGKNLEVPDRVRAVRGAQVRPPRAAPRRPHGRHRRALERAAPQRRRRPHRRGHARHRRPDAQVARRRVRPTRPRSTRSSTRSSGRRVDHKEKPRVRVPAGGGEGAPPQDRRRHGGRRRRERQIVKTKRFAIEPMFEEDAVARDGGARPRLLRVRQRRERAGRGPLPARGRRLRADRAGRRRRVRRRGRKNSRSPDVTRTGGPGSRRLGRRGSGGLGILRWYRPASRSTYRSSTR